MGDLFAPLLPGVGQPTGIEAAEDALKQRPNDLGMQPYKVMRATVVFGVVQRFIPGQAGRLFGVGLSGLEKEPSGGVRPTPATALNALPVPFGFLAPQSIGLAPNFYLPPGITEAIPPVVDHIGFGIPEQRLEDQLRAAARQPERDRIAAELVAPLDVRTLEAIERRDFTNPLVQRIRPLFPPAPNNAELESAAVSELRRRGLRGPGLAGLVADTHNALAGLVAEVQSAPPGGGAAAGALFGAVAGSGPPGGGAPPGGGLVFMIAAGSTQPALVEPHTAAAIAIRDAAEGINRELVSERADP